MKNIISILIISLFTIIACKDKEVKQPVANDEGAEVQSTLESVTFVKLWESDTLLTTSESVIFDEKRNVFYVSCINGVSPWIHDGDGFIAKMDREGKILERKWVEGISAPKGMGIYEDALYVTDIDQVVRIDINTGEISARFPIEGGMNINDLAVAHDGDVFVSDSKGSAIYKITGDEVTQMLKDSIYGGINGLFMLHDTLFFAANNEGAMYRIQHNDLGPKKLVSLPAWGDGVEKYQEGFIVSSWQGLVYYIDKDWNFKEILNTKDKGIYSADIEIIEAENLLLIPTFFDNRVVAYKIMIKP